MAERLRILLVDDEPDILKMVGKRLESEGYEVSLAIDGEEALEKIQEENPDLVILDIMLPKVNGFEVCRQLKQNSLHQGIPVILFTAMTQQKDKRLGLECGADAYVCKPFRTDELLDKIRELARIGGNVKKDG